MLGSPCCVAGTVPQRSPTPLLCPQSHSTAGLVVSLPACCGSRLSHLEIQIATSTDNGRLALANCPIDELVWVPPPSVVIDGTSAQSSTCVELGRHFWPSQSKLPLPTLRHLLSRRPYMECTASRLEHVPDYHGCVTVVVMTTVSGARPACWRLIHRADAVQEPSRLGRV